MATKHKKGAVPCFVDGRTTKNTYLVVAVRPGQHDYNCLGVRNLGGGRFKLHYWPNARVFGVQTGPQGYNRGKGGLSQRAYEGDIISKEEVQKLLAKLDGVPGLSVAPSDMVTQVLVRGYNQNEMLYLAGKVGAA